MSSDMDIDIDMALIDNIPDFLDFSNYSYSTTTPTSDDDNTCNWNNWSPLIDLESITVGQLNFHDFIDSITDDDNLLSSDPTPDNSVAAEEELTGEGCNSGSPTEDEDADDDRKGLRLVHLLMAVAEALTGANKSHDLARVILIRLKELVSPSHSQSHATNMERLAAYFTEALQSLLDGADAVHVISGPHCEIDILAAFQILQDMSPYVKFAHFTANQAILEAVAHERRVHIVDYDVMEGAQWASLMQALSTRKDGLPGPHLRITALSRTCSRGKRSIATIQETGRRLTAFAASVGQPFTFHQCKLDPNETFRASSLKLVRGEALVFNCMMHLPHQNYRAHDSVASFLNGAKELSPRLVTLVEEEVGPVSDAGFVGLFMDSLHRYSAMYDSLEAGFPMQKWARTLVERVFYGPRITGSVAQLYRIGEEDEKGSLGEWLGVLGFTRVPLSHANRCQARLLLGLFNDGYRLEELGSNKLALGWKSRRLLSASVWTYMSESEF